MTANRVTNDPVPFTSELDTSLYLYRISCHSQRQRLFFPEIFAFEMSVPSSTDSHKNGIEQVSTEDKDALQLVIRYSR